MVRTRKAILPDVERIHAIIRPYSEIGTLLPRTTAELCENVRDFVVLEHDRSIIGCGALHLYGAHLAEIRSITVDPRSQSNGGGKRLVKALLAQDAALQSRTNADYCDGTPAVQYLRYAIRRQSCSSRFVIRDIGEKPAGWRPELIVYNHDRPLILYRL